MNIYIKSSVKDLRQQFWWKQGKSPQPTATLGWSVKIKLIQEDKLGSTFKLVGADISFNRTRYVVIDSILIFCIVYV